MPRFTPALIVTACAAAACVALAQSALDPIRSGAAITGGALGIALGRLAADLIGRLMHADQAAEAYRASARLTARRVKAGPHSST